MFGSSRFFFNSVNELILFNSEHYWKIDERTLLLKSTGRTRNLFSTDFSEVPDSVTHKMIGRDSGLYAYLKNRLYRMKYTNAKFHIDKRWSFPPRISGRSCLHRIDAAVSYNDWGSGTSFLFHEAKFFSCENCLNYSSMKVERNISDTWPGIPNDLTAAVYSYQKGKYYFFRKDMYWSFDSASKQVDRGYPKRVSELLGK